MVKNFFFFVGLDLVFGLECKGIFVSFNSCFYNWRIVILFDIDFCIVVGNLKFIFWKGLIKLYIVWMYKLVFVDFGMCLLRRLVVFGVKSCLYVLEFWL